jgi:hypothetical protein
MKAMSKMRRRLESRRESLARQLAKAGYVQSARALIDRGPSRVIVIEINHPPDDERQP